jgi:hypothetical protein
VNWRGVSDAQYYTGFAKVEELRKARMKLICSRPEISVQNRFSNGTLRYPAR